MQTPRPWEETVDQYSLPSAGNGVDHMGPIEVDVIVLAYVS